MCGCRPLREKRADTDRVGEISPLLSVLVNREAPVVGAPRWRVVRRPDGRGAACGNAPAWRPGCCLHISGADLRLWWPWEAAGGAVALVMGPGVDEMSGSMSRSSGPAGTGT